MPKKKCGFGFNCAAMMLHPALDPIDCPNYTVCGSAVELDPDDEVELVRMREGQRRAGRQRREQIQERIQVSRRRAAVMMLMERGCPQSLEDFGIVETMTAIEELVEALRSQLEQFAEEGYIAPEACEVHRYNVKRPSGVYWYNKLTSRHAIFEPEEQDEAVKVIHLSHDDDPRNWEGRFGIARRNRLRQVHTQLQVAEVALEQAIELLSEPLEAGLADVDR